jgi:serine/threonine protein phosphatase 1
MPGHEDVRKTRPLPSQIGTAEAVRPRVGLTLVIVSQVVCRNAFPATESKLRSWLERGGEETLNSYPYEGGEDIIPWNHVECIRRCREFYETSTHIFVHANYDPHLALEYTGRTTLGWKFIEDENVLQKHFSGKTAVVGHTPQVSGLVLNLGFLICIDTDCSRGGWLTALEVCGGAVFQANQEGQIRTSVLGQS